jgi:hypothetical protein
MNLVMCLPDNKGVHLPAASRLQVTPGAICSSLKGPAYGRWQFLILILVFWSFLACGMDHPTRPCSARYQVKFLQPVYNADEGTGDCDIPLQRSTSAGGALIRVQVVGGTATSHVDYELESSQVFFDADSIGYCRLRIHDDATSEPTEEVLLQLLDPDSDYCVAGTGRAALSILDNDTHGSPHSIRIPLPTGASWTYDYTREVMADGGEQFEQRGQRIVVVADSQTCEGNPYWRLSGLPGLGSLLLRQEESTIMQVPDPEYPDLARLGHYDDPPWTIMDFDAPAGTTWTPATIDTVDYPGEPAVKYVVSIRSLGRSVVVTPAGVFADAAVFLYRFATTVPIRPPFAESSADIRLYFVDGIGIVRMAGYSSGWHYHDSLKWDLRNWQLPDTRRFRDGPAKG